MEGSGSERSDRNFVGRQSQLGSVTTAIESGLAARPALVWIVGDAGTGKTTLVREAQSRLPEGVFAIAGQADELAKDVPYELARQLGARSTDGAFAVGRELLGLWSQHQEHGALLVVVEDLHWADRLSSDALLSAARLLEGDRVTLLVTSRNRPAGGWERLLRDRELYTEISLGAFDSDEVAAVAAIHGIELTQRQATRLTQHTGGLPLWVRTLLADLTPTELQTPGDLPAPRSLASAVTARLSEVKAPGQSLAAALAVINQQTALSVVGRVAGIVHPLEPWEELLATGFVRWDSGAVGSPVEFTHPLYRQAVYDDLAPTRRRDLHRAAARILTPTAVLAHRVAATDGADDALADELDAAAEAESAAGADALAARDLLWASEISGSTERSEHRLVGAALAFLDAQQASRAAALRHQVESCPASPGRDLVLGLTDWELGHPGTAEGWLRQAVDDDDGRPDPIVARAWAQLAEIFVVTGRPSEAIEAAARGLHVAQADTPAERLGWIHRSLSEGMLHGTVTGLDRLEQRLPADPADVADRDVDILVARATLGYYAGRMESTLVDLRAILRQASRGSAPVQLARTHYLTAAVLTHRGDWDEAMVHARTACALAADDQLVWIEGQCHAALGTLLAYRGDWEGADLHVRQAVEMSSIRENREASGAVRLAAAAVARAKHDASEVIDQLSPMASFPEQSPSLYLFWPLLIDALVDFGRTDEARLELGRMSDAVGARRISLGGRVERLTARIAAASGQLEEASNHYEAALRTSGPDDPFLERALLHQDYGRFLLNRRQRRSGIDHLRTARQLLAAVDAAPFVARVDADLAAAGLSSPKLSSSTSVLHLTDRERDVATLVAQGRSNPEVAAQLYVSRKAVEFHLRNIYGKLGITSRRELRDLHR